MMKSKQPARQPLYDNRRIPIPWIDKFKQLLILYVIILATYVLFVLILSQFLGTPFSRGVGRLLSVTESGGLIGITIGVTIGVLFRNHVRKRDWLCLVFFLPLVTGLHGWLAVWKDHRWLNEPFVDAVQYARRNNDQSLIHWLLSKNSDLDEADKYGNIPLFLAIRDGDTEFARLLLEHGADPNLLAEKNESPVAAAVDQKEPEILDLLFDHGAVLDASPGVTSALLYGAVKTGDASSALSLLQHGADPNDHGKRSEPPLFRVAESGDIQMAEILLKHGADPNIVAGSTALGRAVYRNQIGMVRYLLQSGADPNLGAGEGLTPLYFALKHGRPDIARLLLENGADPDEVQYGVQNWLAKAIREYDNPMIELLITHGVSPYERSKVGRRPIDIAFEPGKRDILLDMVDLGIELNHPGTNNHSPLHHAIRRRDIELFDYLIEKGADLRRMNENGTVDYDGIVRSGDVAWLERLLAHGADPNERHHAGFAPLDVAVWEDQQECAKVLVRYGADPNLKYEMAYTPLQYAQKHNKTGFVELFEAALRDRAAGEVRDATE